MTLTSTEPIPPHWTSHDPDSADVHSPGEHVPIDHFPDTDPESATAAEVCELLAKLKVADIEASVVPYLAAAAAEMALGSGTAWRSNADEAPVALLRVIAKVAMSDPQAGGPHTARLLLHLRCRPEPQE